MKTTEEEITKQNKRSVWIGVGVVVGVIVLVGVIGLVALAPEKEEITGEVNASEYRVSGKVPGRVEELYVSEGDKVRKGDTLACIPSPEVDAKMQQAKAARAAAMAQSDKANAGARSQVITAARELYNKAQAAEDVYKKSYDRTKVLFEKKVISAQKMDEVEARYKAAVADCAAAKSQYEMAMEGAQAEDKAAAAALVASAQGAVSEVEAYEEERYLLSPSNGEVAEIYPRKGELVGQGSPVMSILDMSDVWFTFAVREDQLHGMKVGDTIEVIIPALSSKAMHPSVIRHMAPMASYATWRATKNSGQYDVKSFDIKAVPLEKDIKGLRPGMTAMVKQQKRFGSLF